MSSLRSQLGKKLSYKTKDAEYQGETYKFGGYPSSSLLLETNMPDASSEKLATLWNVQFCPVDEDGAKVKPMPIIFKGENIGPIKAVCHYIVPIDGEPPVTLTEVAEIFATDPGLFANLYGAAMTVMTAQSVVEVAAGNSAAEETAT